MTEDVDVIDRLPVAIAVVAPGGAVVHLNVAARRLLGDTVAALAFSDWFADAFRESARSFLAAVVDRDVTESVFFAGETARTPHLWLEVSGADLTGDLGGVALVLHDATAARRAEQEATRRAVTDELTGLPNRALLMERLSEARRSGNAGAVVLLDLDQFKMTNDSHGHQAGDGLLTELAHRIAAVIPPHATFGRLGGDEFLLVLPDTDLAAAESVTESVLAAVRRPVDVGTLTVITSASAGVASVTGPSTETVLRNADVAMYEAKAGGGGQLTIYRPDSEAFARSRRELMRQNATLRERNERLAAESRTDPLTGLPNRRAFDEAVRALDATSRRAGRSYAVAYLDIDFFHSVNRAFDDDIGDATLQSIASALSASCRAGDIVYRKGGEELVALLPDTDLPAAVTVAERFRETVRDLGLPTGRADRDAVTLSGGVAALDVEHHSRPDDVVAAANRAMLLAKRGGRDRICIADAGEGDRPDALSG